MPNQNQLDAIALLKADHREVEDLFAKFKAAKGTAQKKTLVQQICTELSAHTGDRGGNFLSGLPRQGRRRLAE